MPAIPGLTLPQVTALADTPQTVDNQTCAAFAVSGTQRFSYWVFPDLDTSNWSFPFYRLDHWTGTWQRLTSPATIGSVVTPGAAAVVYDEATQRIWLYVSHTVTGPLDTATMRHYDIESDSWSTVSGTTPYVGADAAVCVAAWLGGPAYEGAPDVNGDSNTVYVVGGTDIQILTVSGPTWNAGPTRTAAGAGLGLFWAPRHDPTVLYAPRGGNDDVIDVYTMAGAGAWSSVTLVPAGETVAAGCAWAHMAALPDTAFLRTTDGRALAVTLPTTGDAQTAGAASLGLTETTPVSHAAFGAAVAGSSPGEVHYLLYAAAMDGTGLNRVDLVA